MQNKNTDSQKKLQQDDNNYLPCLDQSFYQSVQNLTNQFENDKNAYILNFYDHKHSKNKIDQESSQDQEEIKNNNLLQKSINQNQNQQNLLLSEFSQEYLRIIINNQTTQKNFQEFFNGVDINELQNQILSKKQFLKCTSFEKELSIISIQTSKYSQNLTIWIQCGWYKTKVIILNYLPKDCQTNPLHHSAHINGFGAFGNLYFVQFYKENYAVKCILMDCHNIIRDNHLNSTVNSITGVLKEYFFLKLFSELKIGPKLKESFGFDLIISHDCIEFSMELCKPFVLTPENEQKLIKNMKKMHLLQIVHRDIKPDNLMWSEEYQTPVFIDFGVTTFIKERVGYKSMTRFAGTIGFVSPEMTTVFAEKKGVADLYYNDLYGLNQSFAFMKRFTNTQQSVETQQLKPTLIRDSAFTMHLLKHKLLTKKYTEFSQMWQELQKYHFYELESIECGILQFLIDLRPTDFLSKLYRQISEESRSIKQFEGLKDIYMSELSAILSIWTKFPQKKNKFERIISIYKHISVQIQTMSTTEKKIEQLLIQKREMIDYVNESTDISFSQVFQDQDIIIYFVILSYYCTLAHDKYEIKINQKIKAAKQAVKIITMIQNKKKQKKEQQIPQRQQKEDNIMDLEKLQFVCHMKQLEPIAILYQYIVFRFWPQMPLRFRNDILKFVISSLSLMGYPFYIEAAKNVFKYYLFKEHHSRRIFIPEKVQDRMLKILLFWKCVSIINVYSEICYDRQDTNFIMPKQIMKILQQEALNYQQSLMYDHIDNNFMILNHHIYQFYKKNNCVKSPSDLILKILEELEKQIPILENGFNWQKFYSQYKQSIRLLFNFLPGKEIKSIWLGIYSQKGQIIWEQEDSSDLSLYFTSFLKHCIISWNLQRVGKVLKIIDQIIPYHKISERLFIDFRIYVAWKMHDIPTIKRITSTAFQATQKVSPFNLNFLHSVGVIIHKILQLQRKGFWDYIIEKLICYNYLQKIVQRIKEYIEFYTDVQNLPHPDEIFASVDDATKKQQSLEFKQKNFFIDEGTMINFIINQKQEQLFKIFDKIKSHISILSSLLRYALIFMDEGLKKQYDQLLPVLQKVDVVTHLRMILPDRLRKSIFLSQKTQQDLRIFLNKSIQLLSSPQVSLSKFYNAKWNLNNKILLEIPIEHRNDFSSMTQNFSQNYQQIKVFKKQLNNNFVHDISPSPRVSVLYYISKLIANEQKNIDDYKELIQLYRVWKGNQDIFKVMFETQMIKYLINAFIYCQSPYSQFLQFLLDITSFLKSIQDNFAVQIFREAIWDKLFCLCSHCFAFPPKNWNPHKFIKFIYGQRMIFSQASHPYMAIIMTAAVPNKFIPIKIKKYCLVYSVRSIEYLLPTVREYILGHLYFQVYIVKLVEKGLYQPPQYDENCIEIKQKVSVQYEENSIRSEFYHAEKYFKAQYKVGDIDKIIEQRYKLKRKRKPGWKLPKFIEQIYYKKLYKYHLFFNGYDQNIKIQPHINLLKQLQ